MHRAETAIYICECFFFVYQPAFIDEIYKEPVSDILYCQSSLTLQDRLGACLNIT